MTNDDKEEVRKIIHDEFQELLASDRYIFHKTLQVLNGRNIILGKGTGTMIGTESSQKIGFLGATPVVQQTYSGDTLGMTTGGGVTVTEDCTFGGGLGSSKYSIHGIVKALKLFGLLAP